MTMGEMHKAATQLISSLWIQRAVDPDLMHGKSPAITNVKYVNIAKTHITAAVSQERERCAKVAETQKETPLGYRTRQEAIAAAIRGHGG